MSLKPPVGNNDHAEGHKTAALEIVEYGDFQCPACGAAYPVIKEIMKDFNGQVKLVFRNFPLSEIHPFAHPAALAAEAASMQGKFWEMHDAIYENQEYLSENLLSQLAEKLKLKLNEFENDIQSPKLADKVDRDFESGMRSGVNGTPTFFVNGEKFDGGAEDLLQLITDNAK